MSYRLRAARTRYRPVLAVSAISLLSVSVAAQLAWGQEQTPVAQPSAGSSPSAEGPSSAPAPGNNSDASVNSVSAPQTGNEPTPVPDVRVTAPAKKTSHSKAAQSQGPSYPDLSMSQDETASGEQPADGSVAAGYRVDDIRNVGPFSNMKLQDTPYSFNVLSSEFIENTQSYVTPGAGALNKSPFFAVDFSDQRGLTTMGSQRGISNPSDTFFRIDGLTTAGTSSTFGIEDYDRIEIMSGVTGFMYGVDGNAGFANYVLKRPTATPYTSLTLGGPDFASGYAHLDVGNTINGGGFGYRFNAAGNFGDTAVDDQSVRRDLVSAAIDVRPFDHMLLQFDGSHKEFHEDGLAPTWRNLGIPYPEAPDPSKLWSAPYTWLDTSSSTFGGRMTWDATDWFTLRSSVRFTRQDYEIFDYSNFFLPGPPTNSFWPYITRSANQTNESIAAYTYADFKFDTGSIAHKLTAGWNINQRQIFGYPDSFDAYDPLTPYPLSAPAGIPLSDIPSLIVGTEPRYKRAQTTYQTFSVGDEIQLNRYFSTLIGLSYAKIDDSSFDTTGVPFSTYDAGKATPTYALLFKPVDNLTTYVSYIEGLQEGMIVDDDFATNNHAVLPPYLRKQYEVGAKGTIGNIFLTLAYFDIDSALQYFVDNGDNTVTYVQSGRQRSRGVEFSATGNITDHLRVLGGVMFANSQVTKNEQDPSLDGKVPQWAITQDAKLTAEYDIAQIPGFTLTGGAYYTGASYNDVANTERVPAHTTFDAGFRYASKWDGHDVITRFNVSNLTDERFWYFDTLGDGRRFTVSTQIIY